MRLLLNFATLALITFMAMGMFFASTVFLWRLMPRHDALRWWLAGSGCLVVSAGLLATRDLAPAALPIVLGNTLSLVGMGLVVVALRRTAGQPAPTRWLWPLAVVNLLLTTLFAYGRDDVHVRVLVNAVLMAGVLAYGAWSMSRLQPNEAEGLLQATGVIMGLGVVIYVVRGALAMGDPLSMDGARPPGVAIALPYLYGIALFLWLSVVVSNLVSSQIRADLTRQRDQADAARRRLEHASRTDHLTGVANRRSIAMSLAEHILTAATTGSDISIIELDLDHFKRVNDTHGHAVGDRLLITAAQTLLASTPVGATVGRWGGEEFLILLPGSSGGAAVRAAEHLRTTLRHVTAASDIPITASFGVASWRPGDDSEALVSRADHALYRAKRSGRDRVVSA